MLERGGRGDVSGEPTLVKANAAERTSLESFLAASPTSFQFRPDAFNSGFGDAKKLGVDFKPWQRSAVDAVDAGHLNGQNRARLAVRPMLREDHADGNVVGPSHLVRKHQEQHKEKPKEARAPGAGQRPALMQPSIAAPTSNRTSNECINANIDEKTGVRSSAGSGGKKKTSENLQDQQKPPNKGLPLIDRLKSELPQVRQNNEGSVCF
jgi:hypothetical protein